MKIKFAITIIAFTFFSVHMFGQNTISYTYDAAGNRIGRTTTESSIAFKAVELQEGLAIKNLENPFYRSFNNEVLAVNFTLPDFYSMIPTQWSYLLTASMDCILPNYLLISNGPHSRYFIMYHKKFEEQKYEVL